MYESISLPVGEGIPDEYEDWSDLRRELDELGCSGIEAVWSGGESEIPADLVNGYHLTFYPDWLDFYQGNQAELIRKFGSLEYAETFYGGSDKEVLMGLYRADLARAAAIGAKYVVFHVSDVSIEEGYTYRWLHSGEEVIDAAVEVINHLLDGKEWNFDFLVENQWWPGFTFTEPEQTARLMEGIHYVRKGIVLDTGHLMNCNHELRTQEEGVIYIENMLEKHGALSRWIKGVHLHQSLSGEYVASHTGKLPQLPEDYLEQFGVSYAHVQKIDQHRPWSSPMAGEIIDWIQPLYLTHELTSLNRVQRYQAVRKQREALRSWVCSSLNKNHGARHF